MLEGENGTCKVWRAKSLGKEVTSETTLILRTSRVKIIGVVMMAKIIMVVKNVSPVVIVLI